MKYPTRSLPTINKELFFSRFQKTNGCWVWEGSKSRFGYGRFGKPGYTAHRVSYELAKGELPGDVYLDHLCRNRLCVNPNHLEPVSLVENVMRGESIWARNARKTHCKHGHEFTEENIYVPAKRPTRRYCKTCLRLNNNKTNLKPANGLGKG